MNWSFVFASIKDCMYGRGARAYLVNVRL